MMIRKWEMQSDIDALSIVCDHFTQYRTKEIVELRKRVQKLKSEIIHLRICIIINEALLKEWLRVHHHEI